MLRWCLRVCLGLGVLGGGLVGCATGRQGPPLPQVDDDIRQTRERIEATLDQRRDIESRLADLRERVRALASKPSDLFAAPFPIDLFRHVAIACLNTPSTRDEAGPTLSISSETSHRLACRPPYLDQLREALERVSPERRRATLQLLVQLDRFYRLRTTLYESLDRLPDLVRQYRTFLAETRADLRRVYQRLEARRPEYARSRWERVEERFESIRAHLRDLEAMADELEQFEQTWLLQVRGLDKTIYFLITSEWRAQERARTDETARDRYSRTRVADLGPPEVDAESRPLPAE